MITAGKNDALCNQKQTVFGAVVTQTFELCKF